MSAGGGTLADPCLVTPALLRDWGLPEPTGTKYSRGLALVVGGAAGTPGAAMLTGLAALRVGAGRLSLAVAQPVAAHVAVAVPESGVVPLAHDGGSVTGEDARAGLAGEAGRADAVACGPGLDDADGAARLVEALAATTGPDTPVLLDAYALGVLPDVGDDVRTALAGRLVLTPNAGELGHVLGAEADDVDADLPGHVARLAARYDATVSCGGWVVHGDDVWRLTTGDTGLGTSGSGDVMAGAVLGLLARGADPAQAAVWGTHLHATAGDALAASVGRVGYLASELLPELPRALTALRGI